MKKVIGLDLGTGSIGTAVRNIDKGDTLQEQLEYFSSDVFDSGRGKNKSGEYSLAAERSIKRRARRLYDTRRRKLWATLHVLLDNDLCPMAIESLHKWETYNKELGFKREYPIDDKAFDNWIKLDFNGDGKPDYSSPFQLRRELVSVQLDFSIPANRYKLGRALYHIAQHRGFKSSKGETLKEKEDTLDEQKDIQVLEEQQEDDSFSLMQASESKKSNDLQIYMKEHACSTAGSAFACLEDEGIRIRNSKYEAVRSQLIDEIKAIFDFQKDLKSLKELRDKIISTKKGVGSIFVKNGLRFNKNTIGKCTFESKKSRCSAYHPEYEKYRAWQVLNNIKTRKDLNSPFESLSIDAKWEVYNKLFTARVKTDFPFKDIRVFLEEKIFKHKFTIGQINYKDNQTIAGCPITARFINLFGENWENWHQDSHKTHRCNQSQDRHSVCYKAMDIFNICLQTDDMSEIEDFGEHSLLWSSDKIKKLVRLWLSMGSGYSMLSLKAIRNINCFLVRGLSLSDSILLAKIPSIIHLEESNLSALIDIYQNKIKKEVNESKDSYVIGNDIIKEYKSSVPEERFADHDTQYTLAADDIKNVSKHCESHFGVSTWSKMDNMKKTDIVKNVCTLYQNFFRNPIRKTYEIPTLGKKLKDFLMATYPDISNKKWDKLYHPSLINTFQPLHSEMDRTEWRLGFPDIGSLKNPLVLRVLNILRNKINYMLDKGIIDYNTRVVIETTREEHDTHELNDANMRWALETYQHKREEENKAIESAIKDIYPNFSLIPRDAIKKVRYDVEQNAIVDNGYDCFTDIDMYGNKEKLKKYIKKYKLWLEQDFQCMYTGKIVNIHNLFDDNNVDIEHTIPRSMSFDSSDCNLTVCDAYYNRHIKKNYIPTQLANYDSNVIINGKTYTAIKPRLKKWEERVDTLKKRVDFWKAKSRRAQTKDQKDYCIRQRHLWTFELNYWRKKLEAFTITEYKDGFKNSQLVDTSIIAKYAIAFLKSVFTHVDTEKGTMTSEFRKIFGFQTVYEKKDRSLHSHHAIDATVLTIIPTASKRDRMLKMFYKIAELKDCKKYETDYNERNNIDIEIEGLTHKLNSEIQDCHIGNNITTVIEHINSNILVNYRTRDKVLAPAKRNVLKNGKKVRTNDKAEKKANYQKSNGDSIRTKLHEETFYGAIKLPIESGKGNNRTFTKKDGKFIYDDKKSMFIVRRVKLEEFNSEKDLEKIIDPAIRNCIKQVVEQRMQDGVSFKTAIKEDIYMLDKDGKEKRYDKNGHPLCPIRHVRCNYNSSVTFSKIRNIKKQLNTSRKEFINITSRDYKTFTYAKNGDGTSICLLYENAEKQTIIRILYPLDIANLARKGVKCDLEFLKSSLEFSHIIVKKKEFSLSAAFKTGTRVICWEKTFEEFKKMLKENQAEAFKYVFVVKKFNQMNTTYYIYMRPHSDASETKDLEKKVNADNFNYLIEHKDFEINELGNIIFK